MSWYGSATTGIAVVITPLKLHALIGEQVPGTVAGISDAVSVKHERVAGDRLHGYLVVLSIFEQPERESDDVEPLRFSIVAVNGPRHPRIGDLNDARIVIPHRIEQRQESRFQASLTRD